MTRDAELLLPSFDHRREDDPPEGWTYIALGNTGEWGSGGTPSKSRAEFWERGTLPWVSPKDMKRSFIDDAQDHITQHAVSSGAAGLVPPGTILFVVRGMILAHTFPVALTTREVAFNQDMRSILPNAGVHAPYLLRVLQHEAMSVLFAVKEATHGTLRLDSDTLRPWPIPLPPLSEQRRIVEAVEALLEQVNRAKVRLDRVPLILKRFRQAVLAAVCSGELTRGTREWRSGSRAEMQVLAAGFGDDLPQGWARATVGDVATLVTDGDHNPPKRVASGVRHLTARHVKRGRLLTDGCTFIAKDDYARVCKRYEPVAGDLIVTCVGTLGETAIVPEDFMFSPDRNLAAVRLGPSMSVEFLQLVLQSAAVQQAIAESSGSTAQPHLYLGDLRRIEVPVPPPDEQRQAVRYARNLLAVADKIEQRVHAATSRADKLPRAILSKAFSGELVPTEADLARAESRTYETAEELLARIRQEKEHYTTTRANGLGRSLPGSDGARRSKRTA